MTKREKILVGIYILLMFTPLLVALAIGSSIEDALALLGMMSLLPLAVLLCPITWVFLIINALLKTRCCCHKNTQGSLT